MPRIVFFVMLCALTLGACEDNIRNDKKEARRKYKIEKVNRERCSFDLSNKLFLDRIDESHDPEGYFKIASPGSENVMQLFVFNTSIDVDEKLEAMQKALNTPDIFTASTIEKISKFGSYSGSGVMMDGTYNGGILKGTIKIFCHGEKGKGFLVIRQTISTTDSKEFDLVESSFRLK